MKQMQKISFERWSMETNIYFKRRTIDLDSRVLEIRQEFMVLLIIVMAQICDQIEDYYLFKIPRWKCLMSGWP